MKETQDAEKSEEGIGQRTTTKGEGGHDASQPSPHNHKDKGA